MNLSAALLTGGRSTRMGRDKALLEMGGEPLWSRQLQLLRQLQPERLFISCRETPAWCPNDAIPILDQVTDQGPLGGLVATLARTGTSHLMILAVDLPKMNVGVLRELWSAARPGCGVVPWIADGFEPLCAIYPREALAVAQAALDKRALSLQKLVRELLDRKRLSLWDVPADFASSFHNANCPSDLAKL